MQLGVNLQEITEPINASGIRNLPTRFRIPLSTKSVLRSFYRASYAERGLGSRNSIRPSVCLSVTRVLCD